MSRLKDTVDNLSAIYSQYEIDISDYDLKLYKNEALAQIAISLAVIADSLNVEEKK